MVNKLAEIILYIARKCQCDASFGSTKLNKILFLADFESYGVFGAPITDTHYIHLDRGPVPVDRQRVDNYLVQSGRASIEQTNYFGYAQKRVVPLVDPDISWLTVEQNQLLDHVIAVCDDKNGSILSNWTHTLLPWQYTRNGEEIRYSTIFFMQKLQPTLEDMEWGKTTLNLLRNQHKISPVAS